MQMIIFGANWIWNLKYHGKTGLLNGNQLMIKNVPLNFLTCVSQKVEALQKNLRRVKVNTEMDIKIKYQWESFILKVKIWICYCSYVCTVSYICNCMDGKWIKDEAHLCKGLIAKFMTWVEQVKNAYSRRYSR